jgi:hypothetical protein
MPRFNPFERVFALSPQLIAGLVGMPEVPRNQFLGSKLKSAKAD